MLFLVDPCSAYPSIVAPASTIGEEYQVLQYYLLPSIEGGAGGGSAYLSASSVSSASKKCHIPHGISPSIEGGGRGGSVGLGWGPPFSRFYCKNTKSSPGMSRGTPILAEI